MIEVREITDKDIIPLAEFLAKVFPHTLAKGFPYTTKEFWLNLFDLWWTSNPSYSNQMPKGWILENDLTFVGFIGNIPVKFMIYGEVKIAAASNAWYVDPLIRGLFSLRLFNEFIAQKYPSLFLFKIEDTSFEKILSKYKFKKFVLPKFQKEYIYIINKKQVNYVFFNVIFKKRISTLSDFFELYKKLGFLFFTYLYQKSTFQQADINNETFISSICTVCDDSFSRIWEPYLNSCDITLSRDTKTLNWLYFSPFRLRKRIVIQCHRECDKTLAGYMVFDVQRIKPSDQGSLQLMDMCIVNDDPRVMASLLSFAIKIGDQNDAALLVVWANNQETEKYFHDTFTLKRPAQYNRYIRFTNLQDNYSELTDHIKVCPTMIFPPQ